MKTTMQAPERWVRHAWYLSGVCGCVVVLSRRRALRGESQHHTHDTTIPAHGPHCLPLRLSYGSWAIQAMLSCISMSSWDSRVWVPSPTEFVKGSKWPKQTVARYHSIEAATLHHFG